LQLWKTGRVPWWTAKVLALELFAVVARRKRLLATVENWLWAVVGKKQVLASVEDQSLWPDKKQVLASVGNWNATVVSNKGACIGVVHRCGQQDAVACNCEKLDTRVVGKKRVLASVEDQSQ